MTRYHSLADARVRKRRMELALALFPWRKRNNWRSSHPLDCGRARCGMCHPEPKGHPRRRGL